MTIHTTASTYTHSYKQTQTQTHTQESLRTAARGCCNAAERSSNRCGAHVRGSPLACPLTSKLGLAASARPLCGRAPTCCSDPSSTAALGAAQHSGAASNGSREASAAQAVCAGVAPVEHPIKELGDRVVSHWLGGPALLCSPEGPRVRWGWHRCGEGARVVHPCGRASREATRSPSRRASRRAPPGWARRSGRAGRRSAFSVLRARMVAAPPAAPGRLLG